MPRSNRKRSTKKSVTTKRQMTAIAKRVMNRNSETKMNQNTINELSVNTLAQGTFYDPISIQQGNQINQRNGDEIRLSGIHFKGVLRNNGSNTNYLRMIIFYAKDQSQMTSASEIFDNIGNGQDFTSIIGLDTIYYPLNKRLLQPLHDKVYKLGPAESTDAGESTPTTRMFNTFVKLHGRKITYDNTGTGADNLDPRLHVGFWAAESPDDTTFGENIELSGLIRTWYKDF